MTKLNCWRREGDSNPPQGSKERAGVCLTAVHTITCGFIYQKIY